MDRGAWRATVHRVSEPNMTATEHTSLTNCESVYTIKRHLESTLSSSRKTVKVARKKRNKQVCSLITVHTWLETGDEINN